jgi:hypothetical protein
VKQLVSFRSLGGSAHASIEQQIGELAAHHPKRHLHPSSTELVSLRAGVERDTLCSGDAYRVKLRLVLSTTTRTAGEEAEHVADFSAFAGIPAYSIEGGRCTATLAGVPDDSCARLEELGAAGTTDRSTCRPLDCLVSSAARAQRANKATPE